MTQEEATALLSVWGYPAYVVLFLATALGSPLTEDLLLLIGGYLAGVGVFSWPMMLASAFAGMLMADSIMYGFGRRLRKESLRRGLVRRVVRPGRLRIATRWFARFGDRVVFISRLIPGTRVVAFVSAGVRGMPYAKFLAYDALGCLIWVPALTLLGAMLGEQLGGFQTAPEWIGDRVLWLVAAAVAAVVMRQMWIAFIARRAAREAQ